MTVQKPLFSQEKTVNIPLLLAYDKLEPTDPDFREDLIEFLIDNGAVNLKCFVATTIYFETIVTEKPITHWSTLLHKHFGETFHYHIVRIMKYNDNTTASLEYKRTKLAGNFNDKVDTYISSKK